MSDAAYQQCMRGSCARTFAIDQVLTACPACGALLDVKYAWDRLFVPPSLSWFERKYAGRRHPQDFSGVWRFRELLPFAEASRCLTIGEGQTLLRPGPAVARYVGLDEREVFLQYEGLNPSGSFKDNGMAAAFTHAGLIGARRMACASTGNTSASLAAFAAALGFAPPLVFIGAGKIALGKLAQALEHGARTIQIAGDFDDAMARVKEVCAARGIYLVNSVNPFRLEGQKCVMYRVLEGLNWEVPDWVILPGGNLGNASSFGKAFRELLDLGLTQRLPRLAVINSTGAPTLHVLVNERRAAYHEQGAGGEWLEEACRAYYAEMDAGNLRAHTIASAIEINRPVNLAKCLRALYWTNGVVRAVPDEAILEAKAVVGRCGIGCEPASAAAVAGLKLLVEQGVIGKDQRVVCVLTGHLLKAPDVTVGYHALAQEPYQEALARYHVRRARFANPPVPVANNLEAILNVLEAEKWVSG